MYRVPSRFANTNQNTTSPVSMLRSSSTNLSTPKSQTTLLSLIDDPTSLIGTSESEVSQNPTMYSDEELANNPSPAWMEPVMNAIFSGLFQPAANMAFPGGGLLLGEAKNFATNPNYSWTDALRSGLTYAATMGLNQLGLPSQAVKASGTTNPLIANLIGMGTSTAQNSAVKSLMSLLAPLIGLGPSTPSGPTLFSTKSEEEANHSEEGWNYDISRQNTIDDPLSDPALYVGGEGPYLSSMTQNTIGDINADPAIFDNTTIVNTPMGPFSSSTYYQGGNEDTNPFGMYGGQSTDASNQVASEAGMGGDNSGGDSVICTELHRQKLIGPVLYAAESAYGRSLPFTVMTGYQWWGTKVASAIRRKPSLARIVRWLSRPILKEMAHRSLPDKMCGSFIGKIGLEIGLIVCNGLGFIRRHFAN